MTFKGGIDLLFWLSFFLTTTFAWLQPSINAQVKRDASELIADEYDYVIIGGGTSGLTVGDRLSEDGKSQWVFILRSMHANIFSQAPFLF